MLHVGEEGLHVEGRVLDVMLESFAAPADILEAITAVPAAAQGFDPLIPLVRSFTGSGTAP